MVPLEHQQVNSRLSGQVSLHLFVRTSLLHFPTKPARDLCIFLDLSGQITEIHWLNVVESFGFST